MSTLLKLGVSGYDVKKHGFVRSNANISYKIQLFLWEKNFGVTRHLCEKNEHTLDRLGGGGGGAR